MLVLTPVSKEWEVAAVRCLLPRLLLQESVFGVLLESSQCAWMLPGMLVAGAWPAELSWPVNMLLKQSHVSSWVCVCNQCL